MSKDMMAGFELFQPDSLQGAIDLLSSHGDEGWALAGGNDSFDWFTVGLRLADDSELQLFNFIGDGTFSNNGPFPDWLYWDEFAFDLSGSQEKESRVFVDLLCKMIGVRVVPPRPW